MRKPDEGRVHRAPPLPPPAWRRPGAARSPEGRSARGAALEAGDVISKVTAPIPDGEGNCYCTGRPFFPRKGFVVGWALNGPALLVNQAPRPDARSPPQVSEPRLGAVCRAWDGDRWKGASSIASGAKAICPRDINPRLRRRSWTCCRFRCCCSTNRIRFVPRRLAGIRFAATSTGFAGLFPAPFGLPRTGPWS